MNLNCLCCGKPLKEGKDDWENQWHTRCCHSFFGTTSFPEMKLDKEKLEAIASETVKRGLTVAGVQKKLSLHLSKEGRQRLTLVGYPAGYILKPQTDEFKFLPEMENLTMKMASASGINTVPNALVKVDGQLAYITRRIDRLHTKEGTSLLAMEDFCQLSGRQTEDKYKSSYEQCGKIIAKYSSRPGLDMTEFFIRLLFCFVSGNSDMHLKNFSLVEDAPGSRRFFLSPAYDLLPVNLVMKEDKEETALTLRGKKANLKGKDFIAFAVSAGIATRTAEKLIQKTLSHKDTFLRLIYESYLPDEERQDLISLMEGRMKALQEM